MNKYDQNTECAWLNIDYPKVNVVTISDQYSHACNLEHGQYLLLQMRKN